MTDRIFQAFRNGDRFDLKQTMSETPKPGPGEVLVRVRAVSINRRDIMIIRGQGYPVGDADGFTPLSDAAGEIVAVGDGVTRAAVGDKVCSTFFQNWQDGRISLPAIFSALGGGGRGVLADHVLLSEGGVTPMPKGWTFEEAATLPCAAVTAWSGLQAGGLQAGDWVMAMGTGGVALFTLQIAAAAGAKVVIASSSDAKLERVKAMGATATVNYVKHPDWDKVVKEATGGGVNCLIELGGAGTIQRSIASLAIGGHAALIGGMDGFGGDISAASLVMSAARVSAISVGSHAAQTALIAFIDKHGIKPVIDIVYDVAAIEDAIEHAAKGAFGKVVVRLS